MQTRLLHFLTFLFLLLFSGCFSSQYLREQRIADNQELFNTFKADIQEKVRLGRIDIGFTEDMVKLAWGNPDRIYIRTTKDGVATVWTYTISRVSNLPERMSIPVQVMDEKGRQVVRYRSVWVNRDNTEEYTVARVEFIQGRVTAFEQLSQ